MAVLSLLQLQLQSRSCSEVTQINVSKMYLVPFFWQFQYCCIYTNHQCWDQHPEFVVFFFQLRTLSPDWSAAITEHHGIPAAILSRFSFSLPREWWGAGTGRPERPRMPHPWRCPRPGRMGFWTAWSSIKCEAGGPACGRKVEAQWSLRSLPTQPIPWFYESMIHSACFWYVQINSKHISELLIKLCFLKLWVD